MYVILKDIYLCFNLLGFKMAATIDLRNEIQDSDVLQMFILKGARDEK